MFLTGLILTLTAINTRASNYPEHAKNIPDWRNSGTPEQQLRALVKVTPGTHHWMPEIAYRYQSLYWAAQQKKWKFAYYQASSMEKMLKRVAHARPKRGPSVKTFRENVFADLYKAVTTEDIDAFRSAFSRTGAQCNTCHIKEGFAYIVIPATPSQPNSVVLGFPEN